jgi:hypothetical protein
MQAPGKSLTRIAYHPRQRIDPVCLAAARFLCSSSHHCNQPSTEPVEQPSAAPRATTSKALTASLVQARASLAHYLHHAAGLDAEGRAQALEEFEVFLLRSKQSLDTIGKTEMTIDMSVIDCFLRCEDAQIQCDPILPVCFSG